MSVNVAFLKIKEHFCSVKSHIGTKTDISNSYTILEVANFNENFNILQHFYK